jgi:hypothetical protein
MGLGPLPKFSAQFDQFSLASIELMWSCSTKNFRHTNFSFCFRHSLIVVLSPQ